MLIEENSAYRRYTRVWHVLAAIATLLIGYNFTQNESQTTTNGVFGASFYSTLTFLIGWAFNFGVTIWVSFIAGPMMYKLLDRHTFSNVQGHLFPIFFVILGCTSFAQLAIFTKVKGLSNLSNSDYMAVAGMLASFLAGLLNSIYLSPMMNKTLTKRINMEKEEGVVAPNIGSKLGENPMYKQLSRQFGKLHGVSTLLNLLGLAGNTYLAYYISLELLHGSWAMNKA
uniref:Transmembrane protein 205-like n=1 Tax=Phallusia mammillata TaxID=59560 RepID=A0A6F9DVK3_9ASCI|nr:transmembrane protein 205-like [Phallusia mammillata]